MADIAAGNVTYTVEHQNIVGQKRLRQNRVKIAFGDGALTYPAGGVPLTKTSLGLPAGVVESFKFIDGASGNGYVWKYDLANAKLTGWQGKDPGDAGGADVPLQQITGVAVAAQTIYAEVTGY